eukprot:scaffold1.g5308.t1
MGAGEEAAARCFEQKRVRLASAKLPLLVKSVARPDDDQRLLLWRAGGGATGGGVLRWLLACGGRLSAALRRLAESPLLGTVVLLGGGASVGIVFHFAQGRYRASRWGALPPASLAQRLLRWLFGARPRGRPSPPPSLPPIPEQRPSSPSKPPAAAASSTAAPAAFVGGSAGLTYSDVAALQPPAPETAPSGEAAAAAEQPQPQMGQGSPRTHALPRPSTDSVGGDWSEVWEGDDAWSHVSREEGSPSAGGSGSPSVGACSAHASPQRTAAQLLATAELPTSPAQGTAGAPAAAESQQPNPRSEVARPSLDSVARFFQD